jgi:riboflavin transporter FmnP
MEVFQMKFTTHRLTRLAMLAAIAIVLIILNFPIPIFPPYLKYDFADVPVLIGSFAFGPIAGVLITLIANSSSSVTRVCSHASRSAGWPPPVSSISPERTS